jgi:thermitase
MKPHFIVKIKPGVPPIEAPYWADIIANKPPVEPLVYPAIDSLLASYHLPVWLTREYKAAGADWSPSEITSGMNRIYRVVLQRNDQIPADLIHDISLLPIVEYVHIGQIHEEPLPEPSRPTQMSAVTGWAARQAIYLDEALPISRGRPEVVIAVLDTGVSINHPEYRANLLPGKDFVDILDGADEFIGDYLGEDAEPADETGHGTHVTGIIAAKGVGMPPGVAGRCKILPVRVLGSMKRGNERHGAGSDGNINNGLKWAIDQGADVINMSLGMRRSGSGLPHQEVVEYAREKGVTIVAATGNDGQNERYYPGALPHVIAVGAMDEDGRVAAFSTYGEQVSLVAPGTDIYSTYLEDGYAFSSGTSHAAPFVSGAVALLKSYALEITGVSLSDRKVKHILKNTADKVGRGFKDRKAGFGRLNLVDALRLLQYQLNVNERRSI